MNVYRITRDGDDHITYKATQSEAHDHARGLGSFNYTYIDLLDVQTDKASLVSLLNEATPTFTVIKSWGLTPRGGLREAEAP